MNGRIPPAILVLGSVNVDLVLRAPRLPRPGETVLGGEFFQAAGGKGANQAVAAVRAGASVAFLAAVGNDEHGRQSLAACLREGIDCRYVRTIDEAATGTALILVDHAGENMIGVASGANLLLSPADVDAIPDEVFARLDLFLTNLETPLATVVRGIERARSAGARTLLNPAPATREVAVRRILELVDVITPNQSEAAMLSGAESPEKAAEFLLTQGARNVIVTLGAEGCLVAGETTARIAGIPVNAVDATAAGDAFNGALAVAFAEGLPLQEAAAWANRAAALSVGKAGAQPSLPRREEIDAAL